MVLLPPLCTCRLPEYKALEDTSWSFQITFFRTKKSRMESSWGADGMSVTYTLPVTFDKDGKASPLQESKFVGKEKGNWYVHVQEEEEDGRDIIPREIFLRWNIETLGVNAGSIQLPRIRLFGEAPLSLVSDKKRSLERISRWLNTNK